MVPEGFAVGRDERELSRLGRPVIVGVGEVVRRQPDPSWSGEPADLMAAALRRAVADAGVRTQDLARLDALEVVNTLSWRYADVAKELSHRTGIGADRITEGPAGGEQPIAQLHHLARRIARGELRFAALCGAEAFRTLGQAHRAGVEVPWGASADTAVDMRSILHPEAWRHGLRSPKSVYPLFENAFSHARGQTPEQASMESAELWSQFSAVAAANPYAWFTQPRTAEDIGAVGVQNRMISHPYPKLMNPILDVDQGAALLVMDEELAAELGVGQPSGVYVRSGAGAHEIRDPFQRPTFVRSVVMDAVLDAALARAELSPGQVGAFELYSCFPCVPKMARAHLGLGATTPLTVTGGLTFFGGPGNSYMLHGTVAGVRRLREGDNSILLYGQGEFVTKHHAAVLTRAGPDARQVRKLAELDGVEVDAGMPRPVDPSPTGAAEIETFTATWDRQGALKRVIVVGRLMTSGARFAANTDLDDIPTIERILSPIASPVGMVGEVRPGDGVNVFTGQR